MAWKIQDKSVLLSKARLILQLEWVSPAVPDSLPRQQTAPKIQGDRPAEGETDAGTRALPEHGDHDADKAQSSSSGEGSGTSKVCP